VTDQPNSSITQTASGSYIAQAAPGGTATITVIYQGAQVSIPSPEAVQRHRAELRHKLEADAQTRWGGMGIYIREEGTRLPIELRPTSPNPPAHVRI